MLQLLTQVLPPGRTSDFAVAPADDLRVQLTLDDGDGPGVVSVEVGRRAQPDQPGHDETGPGTAAIGQQAPAARIGGSPVPAAKIGPNATEPPRALTVSVTIRHMPDNCLESMVVDAAWPDGTLVRVAAPTCPDGPARRSNSPALTVDEAVRIAADPRWGVTMDAALVAIGARQFPDPPVLG